MPQPRAQGNGDAATARPTRSPYELMKQAMLSGELVPGQLLVETTLAAAYQVSRTPIREALTRLEQDGLVVRNGRGLVVRERSPEEILDTYEIRIVLEATAAREAARRRSRIDVIALNRIADSLAEVDSSDDVAMAMANREFHEAVWRATHNEALIDLLDRLGLHLGRYAGTTLSQPGRWESSNHEHRELVAAIEAQDAEAAAQVAARHFEHARDLRLAIWADLGSS